MTVIMILIIITIIYFLLIERMYHYDYAGVHYVYDMSKVVVKDINELQHVVTHTKIPIIIKGAQYSHGGHTLIQDGMQIDLRYLDKIKYNQDTKILTVQSGATWYKIIKFLLPYNRVPVVMQSYYNFSVGGSISVNCHGRTMQYGTIGNSINEMLVMLSDGTILKCSRNTNSDLFQGIIGGYGLLGIILEVSLETAENCMMKLDIKKDKQPLFNDNTILYNGVIFTDKIDEIYNYNWVKVKIKVKVNVNFNSTNDLNNHQKLIRPLQPYNKTIPEQLMRWCPLLRLVRSYIEPAIHLKNKYQYRSHEIGYDVTEHSVLLKHPTTTVLQEYFIPIKNFDLFMSFLKLNIKGINCLNISIRYIQKCNCSILNYAPVDSYSIVLYLSIFNSSLGLDRLTQWTNMMLDHTINLDGKFYLPYLRSYDVTKIKSMYNFDQFMNIKKKYDPSGKFQSDWFNWIVR